MLPFLIIKGIILEGKKHNMIIRILFIGNKNNSNHGKNVFIIKSDTLFIPLIPLHPKMAEKIQTR